MPRTKEFDPDVALDKAMELFWRQGYAATSLADLTAHLGISKASLYATFGCKHDLYVRALERYTQTRDPSPIEMLARPGPAIPAIRTLLDAYAQGPVTPDVPPGCMTVNAAVECAPEDTEVRRHLDSNWDALEAALAVTLMRARSEGEIPADKDPRALARFLLVLLQGMQVVGKSCSDRERLRDAAEQAVDTLL